MIFESPHHRASFLKTNMGLVHSVYLKCFAKRAINQSFKEDFIQVGLIGLNDSLDNFDPTKYKITKYGYYHIFRAMYFFSFRSVHVVSLGVNRQRHKQEPNVTYISGVKKEYENSFETDLLKPYCEPIPDYFVNNLISSTLNNRDQTIIRQMVFHEVSSNEIAKNLGITGQRVRQLQHNALSKLKDRIQSELEAA